MSNNSQLVMNNNLSHSEANDQDNLQTDFNRFELLKEGRNVTVKLFSN